MHQHSLVETLSNFAPYRMREQTQAMDYFELYALASLLKEKGADDYWSGVAKRIEERARFLMFAELSGNS